MPGKQFQVKLSGDWENYEPMEDKLLKRAFLAGRRTAKCSYRGATYIYDFEDMKQLNTSTRKQREIRAPYKWKAPSEGITKPGPTFCVKVPRGGPGKIIQVPHPKDKGLFIAVNVPTTAKVGAAMLVPIPQGRAEPIKEVEPSAAEAAKVPALPEAERKEAKKKWSTGGKLAAGLGGAAVVGGLAVGGAILGEHIAEEGWDATMAELADFGAAAAEEVADGAEHVGEKIAEGGEEAIDWAGDAFTDAGDFIMDLF